MLSNLVAAREARLNQKGGCRKVVPGIKGRPEWFNVPAQQHLAIGS